MTRRKVSKENIRKVQKPNGNYTEKKSGGKNNNKELGKAKSSMFLPFVSAIFGLLSFTSPGLYYLGFIFLVPFFIFLTKEKRLWKTLLGAFLFSFVFGYFTFAYAAEPLVSLSFFALSLLLPLAVFITRKVIKKPYAVILSLPVLWTLFDVIRAKYSLMPSYITAAGNTLGSSPFLGLAGFGGPVILIFFVALVNGLIAFAVVNIKKCPKNSLAGAAAAAIVLVIAWSVSGIVIKDRADDYRNRTNSIKITAVSSENTIAPELLGQFKSRLPSGAGSDLLVLPENLIDYGSDRNTLKLYKRLIEDVSSPALVTGDTFPRNQKYNSTILLDKNKNIVGLHNKLRLIFAGEYWPFGDYRPFFYDWLADILPDNNYAVFNPDNAYSFGERGVITLSLSSSPGSLKIASVICSEVHYPRDLKWYKKEGVDLFINPSSNLWVRFDLEYYLYALNNLRKIEAVWLDTPIVFAEMNGSAGMITPDGSLISKKGVFTGKVRF